MMYFFARLLFITLFLNVFFVSTSLAASEESKLKRSKTIFGNLAELGDALDDLQDGFGNNTDDNSEDEEIITFTKGCEPSTGRALKAFEQKENTEERAGMSSSIERLENSEAQLPLLYSNAGSSVSSVIDMLRQSTVQRNQGTKRKNNECQELCKSARIKKSRN